MALQQHCASTGPVRQQCQLARTSWAQADAPISRPAAGQLQNQRVPAAQRPSNCSPQQSASHDWQLNKQQTTSIHSCEPSPHSGLHAPSLQAHAATCWWPHHLSSLLRGLGASLKPGPLHTNCTLRSVNVATHHERSVLPGNGPFQHTCMSGHALRVAKQQGWHQGRQIAQSRHKLAGMVPVEIIACNIDGASIARAQTAF